MAQKLSMGFVRVLVQVTILQGLFNFLLICRSDALHKFSLTKDTLTTLLSRCSFTDGIFHFDRQQSK